MQEETLQQRVSSFYIIFSQKTKYTYLIYINKQATDTYFCYLYSHEFIKLYIFASQIKTKQRNVRK